MNPMKSRRDEYGWLTYPFWTWLLRMSGRLYHWGLTGDLWFAIAARSYGEEDRWHSRQEKRA